tara:strand:+ start:189 stop:578 length:390 start_codon:yes stop_codon:yes gene_type:complete
MQYDESLLTDWSRFCEWEKYLNDDDFKYLMDFVNNIENGNKNDKILLLCGSGRNGKSFMMEQMKNHFANNIVTIDEHKIDAISGEEFNRWNGLLGHGKTSFIAGVNTTYNIEDSLMSNCHLINMKHKFT